MSKKSWLIVLSGLFVVLMVAAVLVYEFLSLSYIEQAQPIAVEQEDAEITTAPDFTVYKANGETVNFSSFSGNPVVINFWATWCGYCKDEMPYFENAYRNYSDKVEFMMIDLTEGNSETVEKAKAYVESKGYTFPVYYDKELDAATKYYILNVPLTVFIDENGMVVNQRIGSMTEEMLFENINNLLGE